MNLPTIQGQKSCGEEMRSYCVQAEMFEGGLECRRFAYRHFAQPTEVGQDLRFIYGHIMFPPISPYNTVTYSL